MKKKERLVIYSSMLDILLNDLEYLASNSLGAGFCYLLTMHNQKYNKDKPYISLNDLPELIFYRPKDKDTSNEEPWFEFNEKYTKKRIKILLKVIKSLL